ncbi:MAG TPA: murein biosynthesis integral membrane protein MurJ [Opitutales bacterium]|nr:murein biosynthesis integral membrane protein MurJ [Opitutales bacterium]
MSAMNFEWMRVAKNLLLEKEIKIHKGRVSKNLQRIGIVSVATVLSRVLGLLRDVLTFAVFGVSAYAAAFLFAFTLPNLFRRLLGEGSLVAALVPTLTEELEENGRGGAFGLLSQVFSWLLVVTTLLALVCIGLFALIPLIGGLEDRWYLSSRLAIFLFPYLIFVCLAAALAAALNVLHRFAIPALTAVWLNLAMIAALGGGGFLFAESYEKQVLLLCLGVLVGGFLQLVIPFLALVKEGWRPRFEWKMTPRVKEVGMLMVPGLAGTAIFQVNVIVSRSLAFGVDESGVAILYLANRLMEFPLGIFTIAVATVIFPVLSRHAVRGDSENYAATYRQGLRMILLITVPAAAGISLLSEPILELLFEYGAFGATATALTVPVLALFSWSLPLYSIATFATRGFHSLKNTSTPVRIAGASFLINLGCSLALMKPFGIFGLALANLIAVFFQSAILQVRLIVAAEPLELRRIWSDFFKIAFATGAMALLLWISLPWTDDWFGGGKIGEAVRLLVLIPGGAAIYFGLVWFLRVEGRQEVERIVTRWIGRNREKSVKASADR